MRTAIVKWGIRKRKDRNRENTSSAMEVEPHMRQVRQCLNQMEGSYRRRLMGKLFSKTKKYEAQLPFYLNL